MSSKRQSEEAYLKYIAISLPMGMSGERIGPMSSATQEILVTLDNAEKLFWAGLVLMARRGGATHVRDAAVSLVMIKALQTSLGQAGKEGPILTANLLG
jgi:separase